MENWINGSRLHLYDLPLTIDMLERMHATKSQSIAWEKMKIEAQQEAKEQAAGQHAQCLHANQRKLHHFQHLQSR